MNCYEKAIIAKYKGNYLKIEVNGDSMKPIIKEGANVFVYPQNEYCLGDIIVFFYNNNIIIHRIIKIVRDEYWCKGDNAFRIERIRRNNIIGKVFRIENNAVPYCSENFIDDSYKVFLEYVKYNLDINKTKKSSIYIDYKNKYLN